MATKSYQELQSQLSAVISELEQVTDIDKALVAYKRGQKIIQELETYMSKAEQDIKKLSHGSHAGQ